MTLDMLKHAWDIEIESYPEDEAASWESFRYRLEYAGEFFYAIQVAESYDPIGLICGTLSLDSHLEEESMRKHEISGWNLCIHSVAVDKSFRRNGIASKAMKQYIEILANNHSNVKQITLICKPRLLSFYKKCSFSVVGLSSVVHGTESWIEMNLDLQEFRKTKFVQIDAFASRVFQGNPAAVFVKHGSSEWMQQVAQELNLTGVAFVDISDLQLPLPLRWFSATAELELCGHATLAAAFFLYEEGFFDQSSEIHFSSKSGALVSSYDPSTKNIVLDFPALPVISSELGTLSGCLEKALTVKSEDLIFAGMSQFDLLVQVTPEAFSRIIPSIQRIRSLPGRGLIVTCDSEDSTHDFVSRFFAPNCGIDEDPTTGSAHCVLSPFWSERKAKSRLIGFQASSRSGIVHVQFDAINSRVKLGGRAVYAFRGLFESRSL
jgi:predicted PhzF superfamily epimerase YddE/YHI9/GNAT superfamily N-acetyltransferase